MQALHLGSSGLGYDIFRRWEIIRVDEALPAGHSLL